jgi:hypothetical protein
MARIKNWRLALMAAYPRLFVVTPGHPEHYSFERPLCEAGWRDILERLCGRIDSALQGNETFQFVRIKQKRGILRIDWDAEASEETEASIGHVVDLAVARSACVCEICGAEGRLYNDPGTLATRCVEHATGTPVAPRYGSQNIRRLRRWHGQADMYFAQYDSETDTLTEVPPPSADEDC